MAVMICFVNEVGLNPAFDLPFKITKQILTWLSLFFSDELF